MRRAERRVLGGLLASVAVTAGAFGVGSVPASLTGGWLHASSTGRAVSYALCAAGVVGLLWCWWALRGARPGLLLIAAGVWAVPLLVAPSLFSRDVYAYAGQGHLVDVGLDPYAHGPADAPGPLAAEVDDVWAHARSPYGPVFLRLASLLVPGEHVLISVLLLRLLAVLGLGLLAWALWRLSTDRSRALWLAVANPLVLLHGVGGAHNDLLMAGLLVAGLAVARRSSGLGFVAAGAALITTGALVKLPAIAGLAFLPLLWAGGRLVRAGVVAASAAATAVLLTLASGLGWGWLHTLGAGSVRRSLLSVSTGAGALLGEVRVVHAAGLVVAAGIGAVLLLRADRVGPLRALGLSLLAVVVLSPVVQPWYLLWAIAVLAVVAGERLAVGLAAASAVLCLLILPSGRHVIRPPLYGVPALVVAAAGLVAARLDLRSRGGRDREGSTPGAEPPLP